MDASTLWAMVAMAAVNTIGSIVIMLIRGHYHIIETPTRMASTEIKTICKETEGSVAEKVVEQVMRNTQAISTLKCQADNGGHHEASVNK